MIVKKTHISSGRLFHNPETLTARTLLANIRSRTPVGTRTAGRVPLQGLCRASKYNNKTVKINPNRRTVRRAVMCSLFLVLLRSSAAESEGFSIKTPFTF